MSERLRDMSAGTAVGLYALRWPAALLLIVTSVPAGFIPFIALGSHREIGTYQRPAPKTVSQSMWNARQEHRSTFHTTLGLSVLAIAVHLAVSSYCFSKGDSIIFGLRGRVWAGIFWGGFVLGLILGIWIYSVAPA